jgi:hypothetical protein
VRLVIDAVLPSSASSALNGELPALMPQSVTMIVDGKTVFPFAKGVHRVTMVVGSASALVTFICMFSAVCAHANITINLQLRFYRLPTDRNWDGTRRYHRSRRRRVHKRATRDPFSIKDVGLQR